MRRMNGVLRDGSPFIIKHLIHFERVDQGSAVVYFWSGVPNQSTMRFSVPHSRKFLKQFNSRDHACKSTCRNCGGGDRGRVTIYRPFGEFPRAKSYCHQYGAQGQRQAYLLPMIR
ncbi:hypothetical protein TNCV_932611 [Trichonephila clavipes]|nr:hypothetical protein TNCV_932611 [Trichonephila clavipes]